MLRIRILLICGLAAVVAVVVIAEVRRESDDQHVVAPLPAAPACEPAAEDLNPTDGEIAPSRGEPLVPLDQGPRLGFNDAALMTGQLTLDQTIAAHKAAGSTIWRLPLDWGAVEETQGTLVFDAYDEIYCTAIEAGLPPLFHLTGIPGWAAPGGRCATPCVRPPEDEHLPAFSRFAEAAAIRYPRVAAFETWNEPNFVRFWGGRPDPLAYLKLMEAVYTGTKNGNPEVPVLAGAMTNTPEDDPGTGNLSLATFLQTMLDAGGGTFMDGLSFHAYPFGQIGSETDLWSPALATLLDILDSEGMSEMRIWLTETGAPTSDGSFAPQMSETEQAQTLVEIYDEFAATGRADAFIVHTLLDPGPDVPGGPGFGVLRQLDEAGAAGVKPALCALRIVSGSENECPQTILP